MDITTAAFWAALGSIILANIVLSGDNAVVIAMAARALPPQQQRRAIFWGSAVAIVMRIALTLIAVEMLRWPYLKIIGALLLLYIGISLLGEDDGDGDRPAHGGGMLAAVRTILVADLVMSLDNVLAVAAAAKGNTVLLVIGLAVSIPLIVFGSTLLLKVMDRWPVIITLGAALLGYLAGEMLLTDPALVARIGEQSHTMTNAAGVVGAAIVVVVGRWLQRRGRTRTSAIERARPAATRPRAAPAPSATPEPAVLGHYRIERQLGRGAMGTVYLAHDPQLDCPVAIKTMALAREFDGAELAQARERFFREADMAGRLQHPDIVAIFGAGEDQGLAYIVMEYVRGRDLFRHTQPGRLLPVPVVLRTLARVAQALAYAHRQGVVHRDIKPANVMTDAVAGTVKITDFGIARITDASRTRTGLVLGTPSFMSPEQMAGGRVDGRTDLYALGVMLFQLLTGTLPHTAESMGRLMHQIAHESAPDVRTLRPELPQELANVIALALEKRVELRYSDGAQLAADLLAVADMMERAVPPRFGVPGGG